MSEHKNIFECVCIKLQKNMSCLEQKLKGVITNNARTMNRNKTHCMGKVKEELNQKDLNLTQALMHHHL